MHIERCGCWAVLVALACAAGCAGNGDGLNQNGQPLGAGGTTGGQVTADLQSIEDNVFTPICSKCHIGASAPEGLQLDAAHAYNLLVGVPSAEEPSLLRVNPGNPDMSYMVLKIEGAAGIEGGQMPLGETPLPQATIDAIRQWVANGAPNVPGAVAASQMFAVQTTAPLDESTVQAPLARILVTFTQEADASLVNESTVTADSGKRIAAVATLAAHNPAVLLITPSAPLDAGVYRVRVRGTGGGAVANLNARTLGADTLFVFTVEPAP
jgi:methionine-rich copper-binding protein CopC